MKNIMTGLYRCFESSAESAVTAFQRGDLCMFIPQITVVEFFREQERLPLKERK